MKMQVLVLIGISAQIVTAQQSTASVIGIQFVESSPVLSASQIAGEIPQAHWSSAPFAYRSGGSGTTSALADSNGNATPVTLTYSSMDGATTGTDTTTPNGILFNGESKTTPPSGQFSTGPQDTATYSFNNLSSSGTYDIIAYTECDTAGVNANVTIGNLTYYITDQSSVGTPAFVSADNTNSSLRVTGNYVDFDNLTPINGQITLTNTSEGGGNDTAAINGLQLVTVPEPASMSLVLACGVSLRLLRRRKRRTA